MHQCCLLECHELFLFYFLLIHSLYLLFTTPPGHLLQQYFLHSLTPSHISGWGSPGYPFTLTSILGKARCFLSYWGQTRQHQLEECIPSRGNSFQDSLFQLFRTHMKTKMHICYLCMGRHGPAYECSLVQTVRLPRVQVGLPVEFLIPTGPKSFLLFFHKSS